jgi:hypothetical protein
VHGRATSTQRGQRLRLALALLSSGAAAAHFAVTSDHFAEFWLYGAFFALVAWLQLLWAGQVYAARTRPLSRALLLAGMAGNALVAAVWLLTRTAGAPVGPSAGVREAVSLLDAATTSFEVLIAATCALLLAVPRLQHSGAPPWVAAPVFAVAVVAVVPLTTAAMALGGGHGEGGHGDEGHAEGVPDLEDAHGAFIDEFTETLLRALPSPLPSPQRPGVLVGPGLPARDED